MVDPPSKDGGSTLNFGPIYVWSLMSMISIGDMILMGMGRVTWDQGATILVAVVAIIGALAQPFEKKL